MCWINFFTDLTLNQICFDIKFAETKNLTAFMYSSKNNYQTRNWYTKWPCLIRSGSIVKEKKKLMVFQMEPKRRPLLDYLEKVQDQEGVTPNMRGILVDWLVKIAVAWKLLPDTLHCSIVYVDRFLSLNAVNTQKLLLLGVSSMLIVS